MPANKFVVAEEATRSSADRIVKETRRLRREFNGSTMHLHLDPRVVEDLSKEGHLCFCNDDLKGHLEYLEGLGYRYVLNREAAIDREGMDPEGRVKVRYGTANEKGDPQDVYLMLQPWEFYDEDMKAMDKANAKVDQHINDGGKEVHGGYGRRVTYEHK